MTTATRQAPEKGADDTIELTRTSIDKILVAFGLVAVIVLAAAGGLLRWGATFSDDYVHDELSSQNIFFPPEEALRAEGRDDLVQYAGQQVLNGRHAEAYASFIDGHLQAIAGGQSYSQIDDGGARAAVADAIEAGAPEAEIAELQAEADRLTGQRDALFRGETLRGLLLSSFAWDTVGRIAGITSWVAFAGAVVMLGLVIAGVIRITRTAK